MVMVGSHHTTRKTFRQNNRLDECKLNEIYKVSLCHRAVNSYCSADNAGSWACQPGEPDAHSADTCSFCCVIKMGYIRMGHSLSAAALARYE